MPRKFLQIDRNIGPKRDPHHVPGTPVPDRLDRISAGETPLGEQEARSQLKVITRRPHRYRDRFLANADLERLFDNHDVISEHALGLTNASQPQPLYRIHAADSMSYTRPVLAELLLKWPLVRQILHGTDGTGADAMSERTRNLRPKNEPASVSRSICPYCAVGCGQLIFHREGKIVSIEGDPASPISRGHLCPKGAASYELLTHHARATKVKYRAPYSREWTEMDLEEATRRIAQRTWESRNRSWNASAGHTTGVAHLGGATLDIEENYLIKKLFTAGLGMVSLSNQARI